MSDNKAYVSYTYVPGVKDFLAKEYAKKSVKSFFAKLGNSLTLVVEVLPFAGLFAAIGGILMGDATNQAMYTAGVVCSDIGQTVLNNLGLLFMFSIILGFTNAKGFSIYSALIGYIAFIGFMIPFIRYTDASGNAVKGLADAKYFNIWFWHHLDMSTQLANPIGLNQDQLTPSSTNIKFAHLSYNGISTLNTGVLGGIALGFIYSYLYNKTKNLKLPTILSFFEGEKFTSVICLITAPVVSSLFIIVWPGVNWILGQVGDYLVQLPYGLDSLLFGLIKYWLLPFQAHAAFYAPLWWTDAGGVLSHYQRPIVDAMIYRHLTGGSVGIFQENYYKSVIQPFMATNNIDTSLGGFLTGSTFTGSKVYGEISSALQKYADAHKLDQSVLDNIKSDLNYYGEIKWDAVGDQSISMELVSNRPNFDLRDAWSAGLKVTRFISGGYSNLMFATPAIGFAMWGTLPKDRRKRFLPLYWGAVIPCLVLGVSEPIMFMFAFIMPGIYFLWYTPFYAIVFWIGSILQIKLGSTFSQGTVDYVINGLIPTFTKRFANQTNPLVGMDQTKIWYPLVIGVISFPIAYYLFKLVFNKYGFAAPGSVAAEQATGTEENTTYKAIKPKLDGLLDYFGKKKNIKEFKYNGKNKLHVVLEEANVDRNSFIEKQYIKKFYLVDTTYEITLQNVGPYMKQALELVENLVNTNVNNSKNTNSEKDKVAEKINLAKAKWIIKKDKLDFSTPQAKLESEHTLKVWEIKHLENNSLRKAQGLKPIALSSSDKELLKQENEAYKKSLEAFDKKRIKAKERKLVQEIK